MELRYYGPERVLQYRTQVEVPDYSTDKHIPKTVWTEWKDVPVVVATKE